MIVLLFLTLTISCKKTMDIELNSGSITLVKKGNDIPITPPKDIDLTFSFVSSSDMDNLKVNFNYSGTAQISNFGSFVFEVIQDSDSSSKLKTLPFTIQQNSASINLGFLIKKDLNYTIHLYTKALNGVDGSNFTIAMNMAYGQNRSTGFVLGQKIFFGLPTVNITSDPNTFGTSKVIPGTEVSVVKGLINNHGLNTVKSISLSVVSPNAVSSIAAYDSLGLLLGSTTIFTGNIAIISTNYPLKEGINNLVIKLQLKQINSSINSNVNIATNIISMAIKTIDGISMNTTGIAIGNDIYAVKAYQEITSIFPVGNIINGSINTIGRVNIKSIGGITSTKVLSWNVNLVDNGPEIDTLKLFNMGIKVNGTVYNIGTYFITNSFGAKIDSIVLGFKLYITFLTEVNIPENTITSFELIAIPKGFLHSGDAISSIIMADDTQTSYRYLNSGGSSSPNNVLAKLFNSQTPSTGAVLQSFLYSDKSEGQIHSYSLGASTPDWFNSFSLQKNINQYVIIK